MTSEGEESLCFTAAATKKMNNEISTQAYLESILAHCRGVRHGNNKKCNDDVGDKDLGGQYLVYYNRLDQLDPLTLSLRLWALKLEPVSDTSTLLHALTAYLSCDVEGFQTSLDEIDRVYGTALIPIYLLSIRGWLCRNLVFSAVKEGNLDMLPPLLQEDLHLPAGNDAFRYALRNHGTNVPNGAEVLRLLSEAGYNRPHAPNEYRGDPNHPLNIR